MFPEMMQRVEEIGDTLVKKIHGRRIERGDIRSREVLGEKYSTKSVSAIDVRGPAMQCPGPPFRQFPDAAWR
jgi:hypothetical protein